MKLRLRDIVSYQGKDYVVEGLLTYRLGGKVLRLCRVVDGSTVRWVEPLVDDSDDRMLILDEVTGVDLSTPPPSSISYQGKTYLPKLQGQSTVEVAGKVPDRLAGSCEIWRYRAAGDVFLQIERWSDRIVILAGESVHKDMVDILPAP
ncbi:MAG TPA: DUF4178 domain-containing protein [Polyangia bacterium]|nr:DUF4178 domain-containing protein [Polyangia bacterium]